MNEQSLEDLTRWMSEVNAKSTPKTKALQSDTLNEIVRQVKEGPGAPPGYGMTLVSPVNLSVVTVSGNTSKRHFIGGEEIVLVGYSIAARTYKPILQFIPAGVSDIKTIKIELAQALKIVSGLEIRIMAADVHDRLKEIHNGFVANIAVKESERLSGHYDKLGYASW